MKNFSLFLAYFLKYAGIAGVLLFIIALGVVNSVGNSSRERISILFYIIVSIVLFFVGNIWSKKLLKK